jgi:hypothetical protein
VTTVVFTSPIEWLMNCQSASFQLECFSGIAVITPRVNSAHMFVGTQADNLKDKRSTSG